MKRSKSQPTRSGRDNARRSNEQTSAALIGLRAEVVDLLCECGRRDCNVTLKVGYTAYRNIRLQGEWFVVANGHSGDDETVVHRDPEFLIVTASSVSAPMPPLDEP